MTKGKNLIVIFCRFCDLSSVLEPGRPVRTDKPSILDDAIRVLSQLKTEAQELKTKNEKLLEEIKCLKVSIVSDIFCSELNIYFYYFLHFGLVFFEMLGSRHNSFLERK